MDIVNRGNYHIKTRKIFSYNIFKINKDKLLLANKPKLSIIIYTMKDDKE